MTIASRWSLGFVATSIKALYESSDQVFASSPLGPRAGLAWDVTTNHRTVVRAHYGRYHDQLFSALYSRKDASAFNPRTRYQIVDGQLGPLQTSDVPPAGCRDFERHRAAARRPVDRQCRP
jgi:hypothetical protein